MPSKVGIVNIALGHIGVGRAISNLETESSQEAITARLFYDLALETVLRDSPWPFAAKIAVLSLIEEEPNTEWAFSYLLASLMAPKLTGGDPFKLGVRALQLYQYEIFRAKAAAGNESQPEEE